MIPLATARDRVIRLLLRYFRTSLAVGKVPCAAGTQYVAMRRNFRPHYALEDAVIFVCDVELCLDQLSDFDRHLVAFCVFENHSEWEAARHYQESQPEVSRRLGRSLDRLYAMFCSRGLLGAAPVVEEVAPENQPTADISV